jgi:streptogramin lyase
LAVLLAPGVALPAAALARPGVLRLPGRTISVAATRFTAGGPAKLGLDVIVKSDAPRPLGVRRSDFELMAGGDLFAARTWDAGRSPVRIAPRRSRSFRLTFGVPSLAGQHASLVYRSADGHASGVVQVGAPVSPLSRAAAQPDIKTFPITGGVGEPWGTAVDGSGNIWFAEPGCDFAPTCAADAPPGQIGALNPSSGAFTHYTLPSIPGNQPIFLAFDGAGNLWFTTPNNSMIGEFRPSTGRFVGQWPVTGGSAPWDLTFATGKLWYTQHLVSAVGAFDPATHAHQDFQTPTANSNPYGIAASGGLIWFTENNSSVDQVAVLDTGQNNAITEYPIVNPLNGTPHLITVDAVGHPWWTEGWAGTIATLDPAAATPGSCGTDSGTCNGVQRFRPPSAGTCGGGTHTSGIAFDSAANGVWFDNSLTAQVGSFTPSTGAFGMITLSNCGAHPHDGLGLDSGRNVWFEEEFANAIGELIPPAPGSSAAGAPPAPVTSSTPTQPTPTQPAPVNTATPAIRGSARQGRTLTASSGSWANGPTGFGFRWQRCNPGCVNVPGARSASYKLDVRDVDAKVRVIVTASNAGGSAQVASRGLGPVGPSLARVEGALGRLLAEGKSGWTIDKLLANRGYRGHFRAPAAGRLRASLRELRMHVLIAKGQIHFSKAGSRRIAIRLTRAGKRSLERGTRLVLAVKVIYTASRESAISNGERFRLSVHRRPT